MTDLSLEIDYANEHSGWIDCWLTINDERHRLDASAVFPPFQPLLWFVKAVAGQRFPAKFYWDEEGVGADFEATAVAEDSPFMHLKIVHDESETPWFDADVERETVIQAFLPSLLDVSKNFLLAEKEWYFPRETVNKVKDAIERGVPLRSDIHAPQDVRLSIRSDYETPYYAGHVFLEFTLDDEFKLHHLFHDTSPFWPQWIDFLGKIARNDLPAQFLWNHKETFTLDSSEKYEIHEFVRYEAEPLDARQNFRLKIFRRWTDEDDFLVIDEVVDRRQFVSRFTDELESFLQSHYQVHPDLDGKTFDLHTLPLDNLKNFVE
jgi:hypothetical protein